MFLRLWAWLPASLRSNFALLPFAEFRLWWLQDGRDAGTRRWDGPIADRQCGHSEFAKVRFGRCPWQRATWWQLILEKHQLLCLFGCDGENI